VEGTLARLGAEDGKGVSPRIFLGQVFGDFNQIADKTVDKGLGHVLTNDNTEDIDLVQIGSETVIGDDPAFDTEEGLNPFLLNVGMLLFEIVREAECDDGKARMIVFDIGFILADSLLDHTGCFDEPVDVGKDMVVSTALESATEKTSILEIVESNVAVSFETQVDKVEVLCDDRGGGAGEVEREGVLD